jgi:GAF domain-containing protein
MTSPDSHSLDRPDSTGPGRRGVWQRLVEPSASIEKLETRRQARLLSSLLVILLLFTTFGFVSTLLLGSSSGRAGTLIQGGVAIVLVAVYGLSRTKHYYLTAAFTIGAFALVPFSSLILQEAYSGDSLARAFVWMILPILLSSLLLPMWGMAVVAIANALGLLLLPVVIPEAAFMDVIMPVGFIGVVSGLILAATRHRNLLERDRRAELLESNRELQAIRASLEQHVTERTGSLERRARYLEATAMVAHDATSVLDVQTLLSRIATLVSERFGFYHTGIFLLDPSGEWAVLRAASSAGGERMLARGHRLKVGEVGIVGHATGQGKPRIALDVGADAVHFDNPDLPETRSEAALPLRARGEIIGALDVQSTEPGAFSDEDVAVLQTLADQIAMAISNARLFQQTQDSLEVERQVYGELSREAWNKLLRAQPDLGFLRNQRGLSPASDLWRPQMETALRTGETTLEKDAATLALPIKVRGQVIGVIDAHRPDDAGEWTAEGIALAETLADQLGVALDGARSYHETQRHAAREQLIGEVTAHIRAATSVEDAVQRAVQEMGRALGATELVARIGTKQDLLPSQTQAEVEAPPQEEESPG